MISRRKLITRAAALAGMGAIHQVFAAMPSESTMKKNSGFKIGACDWSLGKTSEVSAYTVAKEIGLDGVQISLGSADNDMHLRRKDVQQAYLKEARRLGLQIGGIAIGELNNVPYKSDPRTEQWVSDSIDVAKALGSRVILLAFFSKGDLKNDPEGTQEVIRRLRKVAPKAEKAGVILGIESWLSAEEHVAILDAVGSKNVQVYYDVANSTQMGYNIYEEIRWLGRERICEFHAKENGHLLGQGKVDFAEVRRAMDDIGYRGWIQIEGAVPSGASITESYVENNRFLRSLFPAEMKG
jgi:L-ribulose-5-phosphate 3-epimerase